MNDDGAFNALRRLVATRTGLNFLADREDSFRFVLDRLMERESVIDVASFCERLNEGGRLFEEFVETLTIGETYFFREPAQFQFVRERILPELRTRLGNDHQIRTWSAACSTGEEVYSLAMLFEEEGLGDRVNILGTDLSGKSLAKARTGSYGEWSLRDQGKELSRNHVTISGTQRIVSEKIRRLVRFGPLNLASDDYPSPDLGIWELDLIFCRNVLIYFDRATIQQVAQRLYNSLSPGGWLLTASTDPPISMCAPFVTVITNFGIFYRRELTPVSVALPAPSVEKPATKTRLAGAELRRDASASDNSPHLPARKQVRSRSNPANGSLEAAVVVKLRSLAEVDSEEARRLWEDAIERFPLSGELYYLGGIILLSLGRLDDAVKAVRRSLFLNASAAASHFLLGTILYRCKDREGSARAFRNARDFAASRPSSEPVPYAGGEAAGRFAVVSQAQLTRLEQEMHLQ